MKKLTVLLVLLVHFGFAQHDTIDLYGCFEAVEEHHPSARQKPLIHQQTLLELQNLQARWFPSAELQVQASYQSETVEIDPDLPFDADFPSPSRDQYKATLEISQMIYDGGATSASKKAERVGEKLGKQSVEVDLYQVKDHVMEAYFGILLLKKQKAILQATREELTQRRQSLEAAVENGALLPSDLQSIRAEELKLAQNLDETEAQIRASYQVLSELTGLELEVATPLKLPRAGRRGNLSYQRPENLLYDLKARQIQTTQQVIRSQRLPKISAFGQLGYGKPGLNMLNDEFGTFYYVGARLSWNIWDWRQNSRQRQVKQLERQKVAAQEESFNRQVDVQLARIDASISRYEKALERDSQIVDLRRQITQSSKSKLENGVITSSDYISDLNLLTRARINRERHRIELVKARISRRFTTGELQKNNKP
jgi:outer membrane protein TolC